MIMLISIFIMLSISSLFVAAQIQSYRTSLEVETLTLASSLAANCKSLLMTKQFKDATRLLASLKLQTKYRAAYLFDDQGKPVAEYLDQSDADFLYKVIPLDFPPEQRQLLTGSSEVRLVESWDYLSLFVPIEHEGRRIGTIYLLSDLQDLYGQLSGVIFGTLILLGVVLACSWFMAGLLQMPVSVPLLRLVETMQSILQRQDYSLRAKKDAQDEIGILVDGFNQTLDQLELHQAELRDHQQTLEQTVATRTAELQQTVTDLGKAKQQAEVASEAKSQFLANITHELRTPLIGVLGMNELLFKTRLNEQQQMLAETVHKSGEDLLLLINDVLDFSKIEAGELQLHTHEFELHKALEEVVALLAGQALDKGLALYVAIDKAAASKVRGDELRLRQIIMNLLGNAIKFTERGAVTLKLSCHEQTSGFADFELSVEDTGVGMTADAQQRIFAAFYQADDSHTRTQSGTGLGLAIVQRLVALFDGSIEVTSQLGVGSCFKVSFRLPQIEACCFSLPEKLLQQRLLVHLADHTAQQLLLEMLQSFGLRVASADSATDLLYQLGAAQRSNQPFTIALLDAEQQLPNGQLLYNAIREMSSQPDLRRILLSTRNDQLALQKQEQLLYQPVGWTALHATLSHCWFDLHLVEKPAVLLSAESATAAAVDSPKILLAGGGVASRELIKLALADLPLQIVTAGNMEQLEEKIQQHSYAALLLDLQSLPLARLLVVTERLAEFPPLFVLHAATDAVAALEPFAEALLLKPANRDSLTRLLQPVLNQVDKRTSTNDEGRA